MALILWTLISVQSKRLREYLQEQTFGHAFTCVKLYIGVQLHCSNYLIRIHLSNCYLTKFEATYITWVVSFCACVLFYFELAVWGSIQEAKYTVIYSPWHSWNSNLTSDPMEPCEIINYVHLFIKWLFSPTETGHGPHFSLQQSSSSASVAF